VGHVQSQWWLAKEVLHQLEIAQDSRALAENEDWLKNTLKKHCLALSSLRRTIARLRSRISWIKDGDANTALFHAQAKFRKGKKFISKIIDDDGRTLTSHDDKAAQFFSFYSGLLESCEVRDTTIDLDALGMPSFDLAALDAPFSEEEVWDTIKNLPSDKAPGPDGFTGPFYKDCWLMIKDDIMAAISWVWARKFRNMDLLNAAYITLLPKRERAQNVKDFRPISIVHSFATLVTKLLANRLAGKLQQMVAPTQSAFIKKRFIQDNFMLVQQTVHFLHQKKQPCILFKLDITKAFDSISWAFLLKS
jgi:hypothetical protein